MNNAQPLIMIVEDEFIIADQIRNFLKSEGFNVLPITDTYIDAITLLKDYQPDLVIADIRLHNDHEAGIRIGKHIGEYYQIPVVYLSGYSDKQTIDLAKQTNPNTFLIKPKPLDKQQLLTTIRMALPEPIECSKQNTTLLLKGRKFSEYDENNSIITENDLMHHKVEVSAICIVESFNHQIKNTIVIRTINPDVNYLVRDEIEKFLHVLPSNFLRIHKSFIIAIDRISGHKYPQFVIVQDRKLSIGDYYKKMVEARIDFSSQ